MVPKMKKLKKFILGRNSESLSNADMTSIIGGCTGEWHYFLGCSWQQKPFYVVKDCSDQTRIAYCKTTANTYCISSLTE
jgi:natural product precursor